MSKYTDAERVLAKRDFIMMLVVLPYIIVLALTLMYAPDLLEPRGYTVAEISNILKYFLIGVGVVYAGIVGFVYYKIRNRY